MKKAQTLDKLHRMVEKDLPGLSSSAILKSGKNYDVFGRYLIIPEEGIVRVEKYRSSVGEFSNLKSAFSWCVADKYNLTALSGRIVRLDQEKLLLTADLNTRSYLCRKIQDEFRKESAMIKLDTRKRRLKQVDDQLDKCINLAKYWQIKGFNNETARTGR